MHLAIARYRRYVVSTVFASSLAVLGGSGRFLRL
jgi:hypothetical protein